MATRIPIGLLGLLLVLACAPDSDDAPLDPSRPPGAPLEISPEPRLSVGVLEGEPMEELAGVRDPFLLPDGRLVVPVAGSFEVRIFDERGAFVERFGGRGSGPGEFGGLRSAWPRGDTIEIWDSAERRITRFVPDAEPEVIGVAADVRFDAGLGRLGEGWSLLAIDSGDPRDRMSAHGVTRSGEAAGEIAVTEGMARYRTPAIIGPHPVTPTAVFAVAADEVYVADVLEPVVRVFDAAGTLLREVPLPLEPVGDPRTVFGAVIDSAVARAPDDASVRARLEAFPEPDAIPLFWDLIVDAEGFLWVRPYDPFAHALVLGGRPGGHGGPGGSWTIVTPDGEAAGEIAMPDGFEPERVTRDAVVGIHRDAYGVESVRVYGITRNRE